MSCSLIEAKFQVLDRTIKMMSKSKSLRTPRVASSEQLREIVETQKPTALLPTLKPIRGAVVTRSQQSHVNPRKTSRSQPNTSRDEKSERPDKWVDPKQQRTEQLLQDTWHEIESAINWSRALDSPSREGLRSRLLDESVHHQHQERDLDVSVNIAQDQAQYSDNQTYEDSDSSSTAVHDAMPPPKRPLTSTGLQPKKSKAHLNVRCRSASFNSSDYQSRNWFVPSVSEDSQRATEPKRKVPRQHSVITSRNYLKQQSRNNPRAKEQPKPKPNEVEIAGESITKRQARAPKVDEPANECPLPVSKADDISFYMLELRLVHPEPLTEWRFQATFTDTSVIPCRTVILDDLTVDEDNFLLFDASQTANFPVPSRYFNPFVYFPGLRQPSDLYGHVLRIMVTSIKPVTRIVINTSVQFTRTPDEAVVEPSADSIRKHSETVASQEASLLKVLTRRNSSTTSIARRRRKKTPKGKPRVKQLKPDLESYHDASTASLAMDQCSPWSARDQDDPNSTDTPTSSMLEQMFKLQLEESRSLSPNASPRNGPTAENLGKSPRLPMTTIDKKKMQLQHMRASMRREMLREEQIDGNM
ncbi:hypothetical protein PF005_g3684 [Phytophthora fragariae]|uniref:Uncharacterized protein n=2 Tax=Phytophthora TaxID=4783 RepID=A0A6A3Z7M1_9STRA|nr:hypothetical protein PF009_g11980 [Phytophthora fragariae]KAE9112743.1 hypothetical protein PF007_g10982 [Phytophthora fragariae]KAE9113041.1 hypothetical protein PF010_g10240 [Phytophthora fragariae]KAE9117219.1 hypothetical protein PF006_g18858 [Phytophthora fragariae]KAE9229949.1 hypothetical protein PF005_g3684 [Phytophthora fragariae]